MKFNLKLFGKNSVSTVFYWISWGCLVYWTGIYLDSIFKISGYFIQNNLTTTILTMVSRFLFFFLLVLIFKQLKSNQVFTKKIIRYLNYFALVNVCMPLVIVAFYFIIFGEFYLKRSFEEGYPYLILSVFSLFIAAIFKQGYQIQQENNLTI